MDVCTKESEKDLWLFAFRVSIHPAQVGFGADLDDNDPMIGG